MESQLIDILPIIVSHIDCGSQYKAANMVNKQWYNATKRGLWRWRHTWAPGDIAFADHFRMVCMHMGLTNNHLYKLFTPSVDILEKMEIVSSLHREGGYKYIGAMEKIVSDITLDDLVAFKNYYNVLSVNSDYIRFMKYVKILDFDAYDRAIGPIAPYVSGNLNVPMSFIWKNPDKNWNWIDISMREDVDPETLVNVPHVWIRLSRNPNITYDFFLQYREKLNLSDVLEHSVVLTNMERAVLGRMNSSFDHNQLACNRAFNYETLMEYMKVVISDRCDLKYSLTEMKTNYLSNPNCTWKFVRDHRRQFSI